MSADPSLLPPTDGRQSDAAIEIARGTRRLLIQHGMAPVAELTLANGRRADLVGLSERGDIWIVEVKSSLADFRVDQKWPEYREFCDQLFFAVASGFPREVLPLDSGLIIADRYGAEMLRPALEMRLAAARRKAVIGRFARQAAFRLQSLADPEFRFDPMPRE